MAGKEYQDAISLDFVAILVGRRDPTALKIRERYKWRPTAYHELHMSPELIIRVWVLLRLGYDSC